MRILYHVVSSPSPLGLLFVATTEKGLRYLEFLDRRSLKRAIAAHAAENPGATWEPSVRALRPFADLLEQYFSGGAKRFNTPLDVAGSEFELRVWSALLEIPYGETRSYGDIARAMGDPRAARAVGLACNRNPVVIVTPCHRVIGADGKLVGYAGGVNRKKFLLALEARFRDVLPLEGDSAIAPMHRTVRRMLPAPAPVRPVSRSGRSRGPAAPARRRPAAAAAAAPARPSRVRSK